MNKETVLDLSFNLVIYDQTLDVFRFCHLSVREFLRQELEDFSLSRVHDMAAVTCLQILQHHFDDNHHGFGYAQWYWPVHSSFLGDDGDARTQSELTFFFDQSSQAFDRWSENIAVERDKTKGWGRTKFLKRMRKTLAVPPHPLLSTCVWGLILQAQQIASTLEKRLSN